MVKAISTIIAASCITLTGCGVLVPEFQEFPGNAVDSQLLGQAILRSVDCEIRNSVSYIIEQDKKIARLNRGIRTAEWFENWGVKGLLTLQVEENTTLNPAGIWTPGSASLYSLGLGANLSATANKEGNINFFAPVKSLYASGACRGNYNSDAPPGSLLVRGDLGLRGWLQTYILAAGTGAITVPVTLDSPLEKEAVTYKIGFQVITGASIAPTWRIADIETNPNDGLFSTRRDRTHTLLLTFGPVDPTTKGLASTAATSFFTSQFGIEARGSRLRGLLP